jgi:DNA-binding transcriptional regulator YdaS (Cro superfamily)
MSYLIPEKFPPNKRPLVMAILKFSNPSKFAKMIGVSRQVVNNWLYNCKHGVPARYCKKIEETTMGEVTRAELRPDIYGKIIQKNSSDKEKLSVCISILEGLSEKINNKKGNI